MKDIKDFLAVYVPSLDLQIVIFQQLHRCLVDEYNRCFEDDPKRIMYRQCIRDCLDTLQHINHLNDLKNGSS